MSRTSPPRPRVAALLVLAGLVPLVAACGGGERAGTAEPTSSLAAPGTTVVRGEGAVAVADYAFGPATLRVAAGTRVTWTNHDDFAHTTTADDESWRSGEIEPGGSFSAVLDEPGTYAYHCSIHNFMEGEIRVV